MRWIEEAVQNGRDISNSGDNLLSVATIKKGIDKARTRHAQQQQDAERRREKEGEPMHLCSHLLVIIISFAVLNVVQAFVITGLWLIHTSLFCVYTTELPNLYLNCLHCFVVVVHRANTHLSMILQSLISIDKPPSPPATCECSLRIPQVL